MTRFVETEGAQIAYNVLGVGPLLILVPGGNGDSARFGPVAEALSETFTVATIDRRAAGRSTGDPNAELDLAQAARDVAAVIRAIDAGPAIVFGTSAGAVIALEFAQDHSDLLAHLLIHEPPVTEILPEPAATKWRDFNDQVKQTFDEKGVSAAMRLFASTMVGFENVAMPGDQTPETNDRFFKYEFRHINSFKPNLDLLRHIEAPITMLIGADSGDAYYVQTARYLAEHLPCGLQVLPGNHLGYVSCPVSFADCLMKDTA